MKNLDEYKNKIFEYFKNNEEWVKQYLYHSVLFEPNDAITRNYAKDFLDTIYFGKYVTECDEKLNSPEVVDRNELKIKFGNFDKAFSWTLSPGMDGFNVSVDK